MVPNFEGNDVHTDGSKAFIAGSILDNSAAGVIDLSSFHVDTVFQQRVDDGGSTIPSKNIGIRSWITASGDITINTFGTGGSDWLNGFTVVGPFANVPEFSLTTMLLATLLSGFVVMFVVRRRRK